MHLPKFNNQADGRSSFLTWPPFLEVACALTSVFGGDVSLWRVKMACEARIWQSNAYLFLLTWIVQWTKIPNFCQTYWVSLKENDRHMISSRKFYKISCVHKFYILLLAVDLKNHIKVVKKPSYVAQGRYYNILKIKSSNPKWFARKFARKLFFWWFYMLLSHWVRVGKICID